MNLTDLRDQLDARAHDPHPRAAITRLASVRARIRARRRRRATAATVVLVACVAAVALGPTVGGLLAYRPPQPAAPHSIPPYTFDDVLAGDPLVASAVGARGQRDVVLRFTPVDTNLMVGSFCHVDVVRPSLNGVTTINGHTLIGGDCGRSTVANGSYGTPGAGRPPADATPDQIRAAWARLGVVPGRESVIRTQLLSDFRHGEVRTDASVRLGVGLYALTGERIVADGLVIKKDAESDGHDYRLARYLTRRAGATVHQASLALPATRRPALVMGGDPGADEADAKGTTWLYVDGVQQNGGSTGITVTGPVKDARAHSLEVRTDSSSGILLLAYYLRVD